MPTEYEQASACQTRSIPNERSHMEAQESDDGARKSFDGQGGWDEPLTRGGFGQGQPMVGRPGKRGKIDVSRGHPNVCETPEFVCLSAQGPF